MKGTGSVSCPKGFSPERYWCINVEACVSSTTMLGTVFECFTTCYLFTERRS
jgi:hypothetical protein